MRSNIGREDEDDEASREEDEWKCEGVSSSAI